MIFDSRRIYEQVNFIISKDYLLNLEPAKKRMCIVINGRSGSGKTKLGELILNHMAEKKVFYKENILSQTGMNMGEYYHTHISRKEAIL
jgi:pantothenate kinase-related protein Tda10